MAKTCPLLIPFWIKGTDPLGPFGFGFTGWSIEDAFALIKKEGYRIDELRAILRANIRPHQVDRNHVAPNSGPAFFVAFGFPA